MLKRILVNKISELRKQKKISQVKFAKMIGVAPSYVNRVENGKYFFSLDQIEAACKALDISLMQLFSEVKPKPNVVMFAESEGPEYNTDTWQKAQQLPKLQVLCNLILMMPEDKQ